MEDILKLHTASVCNLPHKICKQSQIFEMLRDRTDPADDRPSDDVLRIGVQTLSLSVTFILLVSEWYSSTET